MTAHEGIRARLCKGALRGGSSERGCENLPMTGAREIAARSKGRRKVERRRTKRRPVCKRVLERGERGMRGRYLAERGAKRRECRIMHSAGRRNAGRKWRSDFGQALEAGPPAEGVARIRARTAFLTPASVWCFAAAFPRASFSRRVHCRRERRASDSIQEGAAPFSPRVGNVLPPMGHGRSAPGMAQGCRRGIVRPLRGSAA